MEGGTTIWAGTDKGMVRINGSIWEVFDIHNSGLPSNSVKDIEIDKDNNKWFATETGLAGCNTCDELAKASIRGSRPGLNAAMPMTIDGFPNPFSMKVTFRFGAGRDIPDLALVKIFNLQGKMIRRIPMSKTMVWDGKDGEARRQPTGVYLCKLEIEGRIVQSGRVILAR